MVSWQKSEYPGVAQLVGRDIWDVEVGCSSHLTRTKMNDPTQFEQVDETCGSGRVVLYLKSLGMTAFFEDITLKRIWDAQIQTSSNRSRKRKDKAVRTQMTQLSFLLKFSSIWHGVRFFNVRWGCFALCTTTRTWWWRKSSIAVWADHLTEMRNGGTLRVSHIWNLSFFPTARTIILVPWKSCYFLQH